MIVIEKYLQEDAIVIALGILVGAVVGGLIGGIESSTQIRKYKKLYDKDPNGAKLVLKYGNNKAWKIISFCFLETFLKGVKKEFSKDSVKLPYRISYYKNVIRTCKEALKACPKVETPNQCKKFWSAKIEVLEEQLTTNEMQLDKLKDKKK